jgi:hypothetical protein
MACSASLHPWARCRVREWSLLLWLGLSLYAAGAPADVAPLVPPVTRPGQFVVHRPNFNLSAYGSVDTARNLQLRVLEPELLGVSCERIKRALLQALGLRDACQAKIHVVLVPVQAETRPIFIESTRYLDGWSYRCEVPVVVEEDKLVRAVVQVLLQEIANRTAGDQAAEIPFWLTEGFTQHLLNSANSDWILQPQTSASKPRTDFRPAGATIVSIQTGTVVQGLRRDPLFEARRRLSSHPPLTFGELSLPAPALLSGEQWPVYQSCSQLLLHDLLELPNGRLRVLQTLQTLAQYYNWQTAFLKVFNSQFRSLLDVEKWWAVRVASFTGRDHWQTWRADISLEKLSEAVRLSARVQSGSNTSPAVLELNPQQVIRTLDSVRQRQFLGMVIAQLQAMRQSTAPELLSLTDAYRVTLEDYLRQRSQAGYAPERRSQLPPDIKSLVRNTVRKLDSLDARRHELQQSLTTASSPSASP